MFELSQFYSYCQDNSIDVIPYVGMPSLGATIRDEEDLAIFLDIQSIDSMRQFKGVCLHELGHAATGALHKVSSPYETAGRSEYRANRWVAQQYLSLEAFYEAFDAGCRDLWDLADYFDLPEQDIKNALSYWTERKGVNFNG